MGSTCLLRKLSAGLLAVDRNWEPAVVLAIGPARVPSMGPMMGSVFTRVVVLGLAPAIGWCDGCISFLQHSLPWLAGVSLL